MNKGQEVCSNCSLEKAYQSPLLLPFHFPKVLLGPFLSLLSTTMLPILPTTSLCLLLQILFFLFCYCDKQDDQQQLRKVFISVHWLQSIIDGSEDRNSSRNLNWKSWREGCLRACSGGCLTSVLIQPRTTYQGNSTAH